LGVGLVEAGPSASTSRAASAAPQPQILKVTDYLVGPQLDDAIAAGQDLIISWPFAEGEIKDFMQAEALWYVAPPHTRETRTPFFFFFVPLSLP
jgi:actin-related protein 9